MLIRVTDAADPRLDRFRWRERQLASRHDRAESVGAGLFVAEGDLVVDRALVAECTPVALLCDDTWGARLSERLPRVDVFVGDEALRRDVTGLGVPLRATGLFRRPALLDPDDLAVRARFIVLVEAVDNPTNLGAIVRSAAALGWDALILDSSSADPLARRALRVSMGSALGVPFARLSPDDTVSAFLGRHACEAYALTPRVDGLDISVVRPGAGKVVLMLGSERDGLTTGTLAAGRLVRIPMHAGIDSLNVGAAAAIALHALGPNALH